MTPPQTPETAQQTPETAQRLLDATTEPDTAWSPRCLRDLLGVGELEAYFQPVVETGSHLLRGVEALARWVTPDGQVLDSVDLLDQVEEAGIAAVLDARMLALAANQVGAWRTQPGLEALEVHVNLSPESLRDPMLAARVARTCAYAGLPHAALWLEVTESSVINDLAVAGASLTAIRELGVRITVDDFGTGYASLAYIRELPIDGIKVDRSFVTDITANDADRAIVTAVVRMAAQLSLSVVVEGVERADQEASLVELGVRLVQGYHYGWPLPASSAVDSFVSVTATAPPVYVPVPVLGCEDERLRVLRACDSLGGQSEPILDTLTALMARTCGCPSAVLSLMERYWSWFISTVGTQRTGIPRNYAFGSHVLADPDQVMVVPDTLEDGRFAWHPDVRRENGVRFLAGVALVVAGQPVGSLWVGDTCPRHLNDRQLELLRLGGADAQAHLELRYRTAQLRNVEAQLAEVRQRLGES